MTNFYLLTCLVVLLTITTPCDGGECCKAQYDLLGGEKPQKWCSNYCCYNLANLYDCCDNELLRAPDEEREAVCRAFFTSNVWAPIVIAIIGIMLLAGCFACCYKCFFEARHAPLITQPTQIPGGVVVMNQQSMMQNQQSVIQTQSTAGQPLQPLCCWLTPAR